MTEPVWLSQDLILAVHDAQLVEHGGGAGVRDAGLLASALERPVNRFAYDQNAGLPEIAAAYAFGLSRNHPFIDGNKRTSFVAAELFLAVNGVELGAGDDDCLRMMIRLASGNVTEDELAAWLRNSLATR